MRTVATVRGTKTGCVIGLENYRAAVIDAVRIVFQAAGKPWRDRRYQASVSGVVLIGSTFRRGDSATDRAAFADCMSAIRRNRHRSGSAGCAHHRFHRSRCRFCPGYRNAKSRPSTVPKKSVTVGGIAATTPLHKSCQRRRCRRRTRQNVIQRSHHRLRRSYDHNRSEPASANFRPANATCVRESLLPFSLLLLNLDIPLGHNRSDCANLRFAFEADTHVGLVAVAAFCRQRSSAGHQLYQTGLICCRLYYKFQPHFPLCLPPAELVPWRDSTLTFMLLTPSVICLYCFLCHCYWLTLINQSASPFSAKIQNNPTRI